MALSLGGFLAFRQLSTGVSEQGPTSAPATESVGAIGLDRLDPATIPAEERFAWQPKELVAVLGEHRGQRWGGVVNVAYSPDGKTIACSGGFPNVELVDAHTLRVKQLLPGMWLGRLAFFPDRNILVTASAAGRLLHPATLCAWDVSGPEPRRWPSSPWVMRGIS